MVVTYDVPGHRLPFHVESPKGELISGTSLPPGFGVRFRSTPTARFVEITFPAKEPQRYAGRWRVIVEHGGFTCSETRARTASRASCRASASPTRSGGLRNRDRRGLEPAAAALG